MILFPRQDGVPDGARPDGIPPGLPGGPPLGPPPTPEYLAENLAPQMLAVVIPLFVLSTTSVITRFYVRIVMLKTFGWDGM
jgi:hypothetical protein